VEYDAIRHGTALKNAIGRVKASRQLAVGPDMVAHFERQIDALTEIGELAALAQRAQPLTDDEITAEAMRIGGEVADVTYPNVRGTVVSALHEIAHWVKDRMALDNALSLRKYYPDEQAQPPCGNAHTCTCAFDKFDAQQAQPEIDESIGLIAKPLHMYFTPSAPAPMCRCGKSSMEHPRTSDCAQSYST
jgi:hypothetical protein